jgi:hypothetical protein
MTDCHAPFAHHLLEIAVADAIAAIPSHRPKDNLALKIGSGQEQFKILR